MKSNKTLLGAYSAFAILLIGALVAPDAVAGQTTLGGVAENTRKSLLDIVELLLGISVAIGVCCGAGTAYWAWKAGQQSGQDHAKKSVACLLAAILFIGVPQFIGSGQATMGLSSNQNAQNQLLNINPLGT